MSGKGSAPRPFSVDNETFKRNFDAIFGKTNEQFNQDSSGAKRSVAEAGTEARNETETQSQKDS